MKDNVKYTAKCELYEETDKEFKFNVFLNETGVIAFSHGLNWKIWEEFWRTKLYRKI